MFYRYILFDLAFFLFRIIYDSNKTSEVRTFITTMLFLFQDTYRYSHSFTVCLLPYSTPIN